MQVTYHLDRGDRLDISYRAIASAPTVLHLASHVYWNLAGEGSGDVHRQSLLLNMSRYCPVDDTVLPVGAPKPVDGTPFDFQEATLISAASTTSSCAPPAATTTTGRSITRVPSPRRPTTRHRPAC